MTSEGKSVAQGFVDSIHSFLSKPKQASGPSNSESPNPAEKNKEAHTATREERSGRSNSEPPSVAEKVVDPEVPHAGSDALFSNTIGGIDYKSMVWWQAGMVMIAETISLGILSLPAALSVLGLIPGLLLLIMLGALASYTGYVIGQFKIRHPSIYSMADAGEILFGPWGREILGFGQLLFYIFIMGSHILTFSIMMNAITGSARACTAVFMVAGTILSFLLTIPRTLKNLSYYSVVSFVSVIGAVGITMICVSITRPRWPDLTSVPEPLQLWPGPDVSFHKAFLACANIVFAYAGHVAFFSFISELKKPKDFPKALALLQCSDITMYIISAVVIYYYAGDGVRSPALDSASEIVRKVAYGVAIPTIVIAGVVNGHVAVKYLYVRIFKNSKEDIMHQKTWKARGYWILINAILWTVAWLIAESVPVFNDLLGLTSALFASWFTYGLAGVFWLHMNWKGWQKNECDDENEAGSGWGWRKRVLCAVQVLNIAVAGALCVIGLYASGKSMKENNKSMGVFSCENNAGRQF